LGFRNSARQGRNGFNFLATETAFHMHRRRPKPEYRQFKLRRNEFFIQDVFTVTWHGVVSSAWNKITLGEILCKTTFFYKFPQLAQGFFLIKADRFPQASTGLRQETRIKA
jgi:hypothetical protein